MALETYVDECHHVQPSAADIEKIYRVAPKNDVHFSITDNSECLTNINMI